MIQNPINVFFSFFLKKIQFNFIKKISFSGDFGDNHSIRSIRALISVSIIQNSSIDEKIGFDPCKKFFNFIFTIWVFDLVIAFLFVVSM
ncbi:hypothetical protein Hanom_Chr05g00473871 [Helianthus anomalus]